MFKIKTEKQKKQDQVKEKLIKRCKDLNVNVINQKSGKLLSLNTLKSRCAGDAYARRINEIGDVGGGKIAIMNKDISIKKWLKQQKQKVKEDKSKNVYFTEAPPIEIYEGFDKKEDPINDIPKRKSTNSRTSRGSLNKEQKIDVKNLKRGDKQVVIYRQPDVVDEYLDRNVPMYINENDIAVYRDGFATADYKDKFGRLRRKTKEQLEKEREIEQEKRRQREELVEIREREQREREQQEQIERDRREEQRSRR